jgi:hypothetical protein
VVSARAQPFFLSLVRGSVWLLFVFSLYALTVNLAASLSFWTLGPSTGRTVLNWLMLLSLPLVAGGILAGKHAPLGRQSLGAFVCWLLAGLLVAEQFL